MFYEHEQASQLNEAEEVFDVVLPSCDEAAVVVHPGKEPFNLPAAAIAAQRATVLRLPPAIGSVRRDHLDAVSSHLLIQRIGVVGLVADQSFRQLVEEASGQNSFHKCSASTIQSGRVASTKDVTGRFIVAASRFAC